MKIKIAIIALIGSFYCSGQTAQEWTLRQCIDYAIEHNIDIKIAKNNTQQNEINVNTAKWSRLPNLNGSIGQDWNSGRSASPADNTYNDMNSSNSRISIETSVPIFTGFRLPNQYALSKLNLKAAIEDLNKAKESLAINVTSQYLQVLFDFELNQVALKQIELSKEQCNRISRLYDAGKASASEMAEAKARLAQDEMKAVQTDNTYKLSLLDLSQLLELPTPDGFSLAHPSTDLKLVELTPPDEIYIYALDTKPQIKAAEYRLKGTEKSIRIAQSDYYPELSLRAGLGTNYYTANGIANDNFGNQLKNNFSDYIGFSLSIPIFNRFSTRNKVATERLKQVEIALQLDNTKKALYKEIQKAWYNATAAKSKYLSSEVAVSSNEEYFRLVNKKYDNGMSNSVEYNEARLNLTKAISDLIQAKYDYMFSTKILDFYKGVEIE